MNLQECWNAGINYEAGLARFVGNTEIYARFLKEFLSDSTFAELETAMDQQELPSAFQAAHTLKGLTGNLSFDALYQDLVALTDALRGDGNIPLAKSLFPAVKADYQKVADFISSQG